MKVEHYQIAVSIIVCNPDYVSVTHLKQKQTLLASY